MLFSSLTFLFLFLPSVLLSYFLFKNRRYRNTILLIFSMVFYSWGEPVYIFLMLTVVIITYIIGLFIDKNRQNLQLKKLWLIIGIIATFSFLLYFKYSDFFIGIINNQFNTGVPLLNVALPIGISFYTFQASSYIFDLYKGDVSVQKNPFDLALYVMLFPQLIAGPIVRYETVEKEISNRNESSEAVISGLKRFIVGLSKKVLISNQMALLADSIYGTNISSIGTSAIWIAALAYTFQIYYDFSGYSDMAIGLGKVFGFNFLENFNYPYIATSVTDFWRRWHISLSTWFKDYVYFPMGGNRVSIPRHIFNLLVVWILTGFWHGANFNYIFWGLFYGIILIIEKYILSRIKIIIPNYLRWFFTFIIVVIGWVIFRIEDLSLLVQIIPKMFNGSASDYNAIMYTSDSIFYAMLYFIPAIIFAGPWMGNFIKNTNSKIGFQALSNIVLLFLFALCIVFLTSSSYNPFIYFKF